uniref:Mos1 transposase HTH domain-containing protein n=1 Tax=Anopheles minimus TaxID=112268 RepID=A0A182WI19_9DIPT
CTERCTDDVSNESRCAIWFRYFKNGILDLEDNHREGRPKTSEENALDVLFLARHCLTNAEELAPNLRLFPNSCILHYFFQKNKEHGLSMNGSRGKSNIALFEYHLFRWMIFGNPLHSHEDIAKWIDSWIASQRRKGF